MYERTTLNNGLTVATLRMPKRASVSLGIWIKVGSRYEEKKSCGISHFLEHLLFKGTARRTCEEIKQAIEGIGGSLNAFTSEEVTCYLAKVPAKYASSALDVLWDMVLNARLASGDIEMERKVILEEIRMYKDLPSHFVLELLSELLWPGHPLGMNIAGEPSSIRSINRKQLSEYKRRFYCLNNIVVVACGSLRHQGFLQDCRQHIAQARRGRLKKLLGPGRRQTQPQVKFYGKDTEQTHMALGLHALSRNHPQRFALGLLHIILGANMSSRLFREVREVRGLAYEISTSLKFFQDTGAFIVHAGIDNRRVAEAEAVILEQLRQMKQRPVEPNEFKRAKEYYVGQLRLALEDSANHMLWLGEGLVSMERFMTPEEIIRRVERNTPEDLQNLAGELLQDESLNLAIIGPLKEKDKRELKARLSLG